MRGRLKGRSPLSKGIGFLEEFSKDEVKSRVDIVALFGSFGVKLEKKGSSWMGSCPFHEDKSPSLSVDQSKGLYHCFGCGESGDVFNLVMRLRTLSFPEALDFLKDFASSACRGPGPKSSPDLQNRPSLKDVIAAYRRDLETSREAGSYLKSRGLYHPGILGRQEVGFASGALEGRISKDQRAALEEMGILNARGKEHFLGCITIPLRSLQGEPVGLYGRRIEKRGSLEHLYMRGPHQGLLNPKTYGVYPERMILTESILDALSLMVLGFQNLDALYGAKGLTETHIEALKGAGTREVILALDNDEAGRRGALTIAERLRREGIRSRRIFPPLKDWNEYLRGSGPSEDKKAHIERLIRDATLMAAAPLGLTFSGKRGSCKATSNEISYKIIRMNEGASFKVNIRASLVKLPKASPPDEAASDENTELQPDGRRIIDNVDLFSARSRSLFANQLARLSETLEPARIERELVCILEYLEANEEDEGRDNRLSFPLTPGPRERVEGLALLRDPALFKRIEEDLEELGYVGEGVNKRLMYIAASSRKMESPISIIVHSQSASGKSYLIDTVRRLMPPEDALNLTSLSDQALNYMEDDALVGKFLTLGESVHSESVEYQLREMLSSGELSRLVTTKDEKSGRMVSHMVKKKVRVAMVMSTTMSRINEENASRSFLISADESQSQTEAIHRRQREKYSLRAYRKREEAVPAIIERHQAAQRLIKPRMIVNPFAGLLSFPSS
ncbi:DNA primase, partial [Olavius algarvensis spirochete endosymbiont]|uniref:CHC2 zinc finger domain-containing protein n=1 Tax=Olavius algarvensis spirochete endosymbiont TaxID=260710 RepID=UPI000F0E6B0F